MSFEPQEEELDRDVHASMRMFERAQIGPAAAILPIRPARVLLVLDGSSQDETAIGSAKYLREAHNVETLVLDGREDASDGDTALANAVAQQISGARPIARAEGDAYDAILAATRQHQLDLVIVPCPFGRDFESIGTDSAGTVIDVLLSRCPVAMLVMRRADQSLQHCLSKVAVIVGSECDVEARAAAWAFGLAGEGAWISLNLVVEKEEFENIQSIIEAISPGTDFDAEMLSAALTKTHQRLHAAMLKTSQQSGFRYRLLPQAGEVAPPNPLHQADKQLLVLPLEVDDRFGQGFVQDRIRRSPHPVLVVPSHVPA